MREGIITQQDKAACLLTTVTICQCHQYWCFPLSVALGIWLYMAGCAFQLIKQPMHLRLAFSNQNAKCLQLTIYCNLAFSLQHWHETKALSAERCWVSVHRDERQICFLSRPALILLRLNLDLFDLWYSGLLLFAAYRFESFTSVSVPLLLYEGKTWTGWDEEVNTQHRT